MFNPCSFKSTLWCAIVPGVLAITAVAMMARAIQAQSSQTSAQGQDRERELAISTLDGFTLAAVGDCIIARPISQTQDPLFRSVVKTLQEADARFGNFEGTILDRRHFVGHPQAEFGGVWIIGVPEVAKDMKAMGFDLVSRANNHVTDWGIEGMQSTSRTLEEAGIVHAGIGDHRTAARAAHYFDTPKGRVALISMASSFTPLSRATPPVGEAPGRPGLSALRTTRYSLITPEEMKVLRKIHDEQPAGLIRPLPNETTNADELELFGVNYRVGDHRGFSYTVNSIDEREILKSIRQAKQMSDFVIVTIHAHEPGNWSEQPADFLPPLAHKAIDAGADEFIGHGPHQLRGIEIYKGKPIFYSLGDFIFQLDLLEPIASDLYEQFKIDPSASTDAEFNAMWNKWMFNGEVWYESVIATSRFERGRVAEVRLQPVDLGFSKRGADRGLPQVASPQVSRAILERLQRLSEPFGTRIIRENGLGIVRP